MIWGWGYGNMRVEIREDFKLAVTLRLENKKFLPLSMSAYQKIRKGGYETITKSP